MAYFGVKPEELAEFARRNRNKVYERNPYWFDKDTVIIPATAKDTNYSQDYYLYELLDETAIIIEGIGNQ